MLDKFMKLYFFITKETVNLADALEELATLLEAVGDIDEE